MPTDPTVVLLLEDEPLIAVDLEATLTAAGFQVVVAMTSLEADEWLSRNTPDVALVDILLRDGRCDRFVSKLVEARIPFAVHSGDLPKAHADTPFAHGRWLSKPAQA